MRKKKNSGRKTDPARARVPGRERGKMTQQATTNLGSRLYSTSLNKLRPGKRTISIVNVEIGHGGRDAFPLRARAPTRQGSGPFPPGISWSPACLL